jgi:hypothetical protein
MVDTVVPVVAQVGEACRVGVRSSSSSDVKPKVPMKMCCERAPYEGKSCPKYRMGKCEDIPWFVELSECLWSLLQSAVLVPFSCMNLSLSVEKNKTDYHLRSFQLVCHTDRM